MLWKVHKSPECSQCRRADTCARYLQWVRPLVDDAAYEATTEVVGQFQSDPAQGPKMQKMLEDYDSTTPFKSYIEEFWNDACGAQHRSPCNTDYQALSNCSLGNPAYFCLAGIWFRMRAWCST